MNGPIHQVPLHDVFFEDWAKHIHMYICIYKYACLYAHIHIHIPCMRLYIYTWVQRLVQPAVRTF